VTHVELLLSAVDAAVGEVEDYENVDEDPEERGEQDHTEGVELGATQVHGVSSKHAKTGLGR